MCAPRGAAEDGRIPAPRILTPSPDRVRAPCPHYRACGGCALMHGSDGFVAGWKVGVVERALAAQGIGHVAAQDAGLAQSLPLDARRSLATYMELFLGNALRGHYRRILVIDADILYERGDPARLLNADMLGRAVAAVRDNRQWRTPNRKTHEFQKLGEPAHPYFNAGVVMIDTEAFATQDLPARAADFARRAPHAMPSLDQSLMNGILKGDWAEISPLWNWQFTSASAHLTSMADPCLIHFIGTRKPWLDSAKGVVPMRMRDAFGGVLAQYFPDAPQVSQSSRRHWPEAGVLRATLFRQWRAAGPMIRYLNRFPDQYTLIDPRA